MPVTARRAISFAARFGTGKAKPVTRVVYKIDCSTPVSHGLFDCDAFKQFLLDRIKVNGKTKTLGDLVQVSLKSNIISVDVQAPFSKRYLKYLTKKYLKKAQLRDWLRVIATSKTGYQLKYFNIRDGEDADA